MNFVRFTVFLCFFTTAFSQKNINSHLLPRPLIYEYTENGEFESRDSKQEIQLRCTSWRFAAESNNLNPWESIPQKCADYVKTYVTGKAYRLDLEIVSKEAAIFAKSIELSRNENDTWVFDIDETLISNLPYYDEHGYGLEIFDGLEFDKWVEKAKAPAIPESVWLYEKILSLGFKVFLLTGRHEKHREVTVNNLINAGFSHWDKLILRGVEDIGKEAIEYKSKKRHEMVKDGYRIMGNSGDQWSDLLGSSISVRSFKLPNPMYYIA